MRTNVRILLKNLFLLTSTRKRLFTERGGFVPFTYKTTKKNPIDGDPAPWERKTLDHLLKEQNLNPKVHYAVDIGFPYASEPSREENIRRLTYYMDNKKNKDTARKAKRLELLIPLDECYEEWIYTDGPKHIRRIAAHYGVFEHLFGDAYFYPITPLSISFKNSEDAYTPVYFGNTIKPKEAKNVPLIDVGNDKHLHTLVLTGLDGHLNKEDGEYVHWFVANIPGGDVSKGEVLVPYLQPFPMKGTGYQRYVFTLYQQKKRMDYSKLFNSEIKMTDPETRTFSSYHFYNERQDEMTPTGLAFFQSEWDSSVTDVFHKTFVMDEPRYEYDFPERFMNPPRWFPKKEAFDTYMDRFRDPKKISKEVLTKKLKEFNPFEKPEPPLKYPNAQTPHDHGDQASWIQVKVKKERLGWGQVYNDNKDIIDPE